MRSMIAVYSILALAFVFALARLTASRRHGPYMGYSHTSDLPLESSFRTHFAHLPRYLLFLALACFLLAWLDPSVRLSQPAPAGGPPPVPKAPSKGIAIYLLLDQSGSMNQKSPPRNGPTKLAAMKKATQEFLAGRPHDLIGLIAYARAATVLSPLTLDHDELSRQIDALTTVTKPEQDGTGIGYALFKTVNMIVATREFAEQLARQGKPSYTIKNAVVVLVTDGFQSPNALDKGKWLRTMGMEEAAAFAQANHVKLYLINVEPHLASDEFAPHRRLLERVAQTTGGAFFLASSADNLQEIYAHIDQLEKSPLPLESQLQVHQAPTPPPRLHLFPWFLGIGLSAFFLSVVLNATLLRQVP